MSSSPEGSTLRSTLKSFRSYKRNQGRLVRQLTAAALALVLFFGCWTLSQGWLSDYVNSYLTVTVTYPSATPDPAIDESIHQAAQEHGLAVRSEEVEGEERRLVYSLPTSRFWSTNQELTREARATIAEFRDDVTSTHSTVTVREATQPRTDTAEVISIGIPLVLFLLGLWFIYRLIHYPRFADFLISVEAEMDKVSWPSRQDLFRNTAVVITTMFFIGAVLFLYDIFWIWLFQSIGILRDVTP